MRNRGEDKLSQSNRSNALNMKFSGLVLFVLCIVPILGEKNASVIIVGAGAAGTAAASKLMENGFTNVKILESKDRPGGRVWTIKFGDYWVDMGGQWVHGHIDNIVYDIVAPLGLLQKRSDYGEFAVGKGYGSNGVDLPRETIMVWYAFHEASVGNITDVESLKTGSLEEYMLKRYNTFFPEHPEISAEQRDEILFLANRAETAESASPDWNEISTKAFIDGFGSSGDFVVNWRDKGYSTIFDILNKKIPNPEEELPVVNNTILNTRVSKIDYENDGPLKLTTADGKEYLADHVIFTCSLGILKANHESLFRPQLSEKKINAIKNIGFGTVAKIYLLYDEPWWRPEKDFIKPFLWSKEDRAELSAHPERYWMLGVYTIITIEHKPNLLCLWMSGNYSSEMEKIPDDIFRNQTIGLLQRFLGRDYNITEPKEIIRSKWNTDEDVRGTYSYRSPNSDKFEAKNENLAEPVMRNGKPILQFAGEATENHHYSTVHGAVRSGFREANRLIEHYSK